MTMEPHIAQLNIHNGIKFGFLSTNNQHRNGTSIRMTQYKDKSKLFF